MNRREFFIFAGATLLSVDALSSHLRGPSFLRHIWELLENPDYFDQSKENLLKACEKTYGVELVSPSTGHSHVQFSEKNSFPLIEWDIPRIVGLIDALRILPPHFYAPTSTEKVRSPLLFAISDKSPLDFYDWNGSKPVAFCKCNNSEIPTIVADIKAMGMTFLEKDISRRVWIHEMTHAVILKNRPYYINQILSSIGLNDFRNIYPLFDDTTKHNLDPVARKLTYGTTNYDEFFSVASEFYIQGKSAFISAYSPYLGEQTSAQLYDRMRVVLYLGKEY